MTSIIGDIRDKNKLKSAVESFQPETIFHLAAQALVGESYSNPLDTLETNILGTANLLNSCRQTTSIDSIVIITTDKCYENNESVWGHRETDPLGGDDPYSSSKACAELVTASFRNSYFKNNKHQATITTARAGNVIGGGDWSENRLIPDVIRAFKKGEPAAIRNPYSIRPWQHVLEPLAGYLMLAEKSHTNQSLEGAWNFGPQLEGAKPVSWIADQAQRLWGEQASWVETDISTFEEKTILRLDCSKARLALGWTPKLKIETTIDLTLDWYKRFSLGENALQLTNSQIKDFLCLSKTR